MKNAKIIRPALNLAICLIAIIVCLTSGKKFVADSASTGYTPDRSVNIGDYSVTDYSYYGGDAYTGIQQAGADASNNVIILGITVTDAANMLYDAQRSTANNVSALAAPLNSAAMSIASIGSLLCTAMAFAFALPGVKNLFDLILAIQEKKAESVEKTALPEAPAEAELPAEAPQEEAPAEDPAVL